MTLQKEKYHRLVSVLGAEDKVVGIEARAGRAGRASRGKVRMSFLPLLEAGFKALKTLRLVLSRITSCFEVIILKSLRNLE